MRLSPQPPGLAWSTQTSWFAESNVRWRVPVAEAIDFVLPSSSYA
jgi:hypothetical protein